MSKVLDKKVVGAIDKLDAIGTELQGFIKEREEVINMIKLALVAKRNLFFLGETGQAKSFVVKEFNKRIKGSNYMELLMNKMMDKDEIYGRLDIPELVKGNQKVITEGKLPDSDVVFLDEIFKSNEVVLNTLLKSLNYEDINLEGKVLPSRHLAIFSASNELPNFKKEEDKILYPLFNRLHLKMITKYIEQKDNFKEAIKAKRARKSQQIQATIDLDKIKILNEKAWEVEVPEEIDDLLWEISKEIERKLSRPVSDRKLLESSNILQAHALLDKRDVVDVNDIKVLEYYLWEFPEEIPTIKEIIKRYCENPLKDKVMALKAIVVEQLQDAYKIAENGEDKAKNKAFTKAEKEFFQIHTGLEALKQEANTVDDTKMVEEMLQQFEDMYKQLNEKFGYTYTSIKEMKARQGF
jgi:MoxR-like ATPase